MRSPIGGGAAPRGAAVPGDPPPGQLEEIEWTEADEAPPVEPLRWLVGDDVPARFAAYAVGRHDATGTAGMWLAIEGLARPGGGRSARQSPASGWSPGQA